MTAWAELCTGLLGGRPGRSVPVLGLALSLVLGFASPLLALDDEPSTTVGGSYGFASLCPPKEQSRVAQHDPNLAPRLEAVQSASPEGGPSNGAASKGADALIIQYDAFNRIGHRLVVAAAVAVVTSRNRAQRILTYSSTLQRTAPWISIDLKVRS